MRFVEHIQGYFKRMGVSPSYFLRDTTFDAVFLADTLGAIPDIVRARNGRSYLYFEEMTVSAIVLARQMGFNPRLHRSHKYFPAKYVYRAQVSGPRSKKLQEIANEFKTMDMKNIKKYKIDPAYLRYIANYKTKMK